MNGVRERDAGERLHILVRERECEWCAGERERMFFGCGRGKECVWEGKRENDMNDVREKDSNCV